MSGNREQLPAVVIADEGDAAPGVSHLAQRRGHAIGHTGKRSFPRVVTSKARGCQCEQVEVERVPVIVHRALGVKAVREHLPVYLAGQNVTAGPLPLRTVPELRPGPATDVEREPLAQQVRIRAEVYERFRSM